MSRKTVLLVPLTDEEVQELIRILLDGDEVAALAFLEKHIKPAAHSALEGG